jgi:hypothetical protein
MRDPFEQLRRLQEAINKIEGYISKGRQRFNREEEIRLSIIHYLITVAVHPGETIKPKTLQTILKQAGLSIAEFEELL